MLRGSEIRIKHTDRTGNFRVIALLFVAALLMSLFLGSNAFANEPENAAGASLAPAVIEPQSEFLSVPNAYNDYVCNAGVHTNRYYNVSYIIINFNNTYWVERLVPIESTVYKRGEQGPFGCTHGGVHQLWKYTYGVD